MSEMTNFGKPTLLGRIGASKAGYSMVLFPDVALILSMLFEGLRIDATVVIGTLLVLAGNVFVLKKDLTAPAITRVVPRILRGDAAAS